MGKKEGVTADEQKQTIAKFSKGEFDVMVATSIGEEGLDIPAVDTVVFFEPIPSEIRTIQRRGRAGRLQAGRVVVLITQGTRDEAYFHSSRKKEENMKRIVGKMQLQFSRSPKGAEKKDAPAKREYNGRETTLASGNQHSKSRQTAPAHFSEAGNAAVQQGAPLLQQKPAKPRGRRALEQKKLTDF